MTTRTALAPTMGVVLVGAHPWANSTFDNLSPRTLLPVAHRPLISYVLSWLQDGGIGDVAVCGNRETEVLQRRLVRHVPLGLTLAYHEDLMPRGPAGALRDAADASDASVFVVADGTSIPTVDLEDVLSAHHASGADVTVVVHTAPGQHGNPCLQMPSGIYVFNREALASVPAQGFFDIKENLIPQLYRSARRVAAYAAAGPSPRVLDAASYLAVNEWTIEGLVRSSAPSGYVKSDQALIHREAVVAHDAMLVGPVLVGPGARVLAGAVIVGPTSIGREATIGAGVLVSRSAVWRRCVLHEQAVADRCILADDAVLDAQTHAFRAVVTSKARLEQRTARDAGIDVGESAALELFRRMGRVLLGTAWSRSPAA